MYDFKGINIHLEISSNCNSRCLDCGRYIKGTDLTNPNIKVGSEGLMSVDVIPNIFDDIIAANANYINFTGTYGDAITHPKFFEILYKISDLVNLQVTQRIKNGLNPKLKLMIETNGGLHSPDWWDSFAKIVKDRFSRDSVIIFSLDGIDDTTHQMYRRGVNFNKVIENAKSVIDQKVNTVWSMISFSHNEHQIEQAKKISQDLGFNKFKLRRSRLRSSSSNVTPIDNLVQKRKNISTSSVQYSSEELKLFNLTDNKPSNKFYFENQIDDYINNTDINCEWRNTNKISIDYTTRVWQCCYFSTFYHSPINLHQVDRFKEIDAETKIREFENLSFYENQYEKNWNHCSHNKLSDILSHKFFTDDLLSSFDKNMTDKSNPRIFRCAKHCGEKSRILDSKLRQINIEKENKVSS